MSLPFLLLKAECLIGQLHSSFGGQDIGSYDMDYIE